MSAQSEALRLADALERDPLKWCDEAAAELRRLSAENDARNVHLSERMLDLFKVEAQRDELLAALRLMLASHDATCPGEECQLSGVDLARAAIAKAEGA